MVTMLNVMSVKRLHGFWALALLLSGCMSGSDTHQLTDGAQTVAETQPMQGTQPTEGAQPMEETQPTETQPVEEAEAPEFPAATATPAATDWWKPLASDNLTWQWQLQGEIDTSFMVDVYNVDIDTPANKINELKARNVKLICYFSAGTVELFRDDENQIPQRSRGEQYEDLTDERWLDYSQFEEFSNVMLARMDRCKELGFDAIEADNVDAHNYESRDEFGNVVNIGTNFNINLDHSIAYVRWLSAQAHLRGLAFGLKNAEEIASTVIDDIDYMITEDCYVDSWCDAASVLVEANKTVFMAEYTDLVPDFTPACEKAKMLGFSAIWRDPGLENETYLACE